VVWAKGNFGVVLTCAALAAVAGALGARAEAVPLLLLRDSIIGHDNIAFSYAGADYGPACRE